MVEHQAFFQYSIMISTFICRDDVAINKRKDAEPVDFAVRIIFGTLQGRRVTASNCNSSSEPVIGGGGAVGCREQTGYRFQGKQYGASRGIGWAQSKARPAAAGPRPRQSSASNRREIVRDVCYVPGTMFHFLIFVGIITYRCSGCFGMNSYTHYYSSNTTLYRYYIWLYALVLVVSSRRHPSSY